MLDRFCLVLTELLHNGENGDKCKRYSLVCEAIYLAAYLGFSVGFRADEDRPHLITAFIELPGYGQICYHIPEHKNPWDGANNRFRDDKIKQFLDKPTEVMERKEE